MLVEPKEADVPKLFDEDEPVSRSTVGLPEALWERLGRAVEHENQGRQSKTRVKRDDMMARLLDQALTWYEHDYMSLSEKKSRK